MITTKENKIKKKHRHSFSGNLSTLFGEDCPKCGENYPREPVSSSNWGKVGLFYCNAGDCQMYRCGNCRNVFIIKL